MTRANQTQAGANNSRTGQEGRAARNGRIMRKRRCGHPGSLRGAPARASPICSRPRREHAGPVTGAGSVNDHRFSDAGRRRRRSTGPAVGPSPITGTATGSAAAGARVTGAAAEGRTINTRHVPAHPGLPLPFSPALGGVVPPAPRLRGPSPRCGATRDAKLLPLSLPSRA